MTINDEEQYEQFCKEFFDLWNKQKMQETITYFRKAYMYGNKIELDEAREFKGVISDIHDVYEADFNTNETKAIQSKIAKNSYYLYSCDDVEYWSDLFESVIPVSNFNKYLTRFCRENGYAYRLGIEVIKVEKTIAKLFKPSKYLIKEFRPIIYFSQCNPINKNTLENMYMTFD